MNNETQEVIDLTRLAEEWPGMKAKVESLPTKDEFAKLMDSSRVAIIDGIKVVKEEIVQKENADLSDSGIKGMFDSVTKFELIGLPAGSVLVGGSLGIIGTELVDGFLAEQSLQMKGLAKIGAGIGTVIFGKKIIGKTAAIWTAGFMFFDALRDLTPLDSKLSELVSKITKVKTSAGLADKSNRRGNVQEQARRVADAYAGTGV